ncbi:MAG TPA: hypothetical protein VIK99_03540 [Thermaerobacter sp.]
MSDLLPPNVQLYPEAAKDLERLDRSQQILAVRAIRKIAEAPDQRGKPLGHQYGWNLTGYRATYVHNKRLRIVWTVAADGTVKIAVVAAVAEPDDFFVYELAASRRKDIDAWIREVIYRAGSA